MISIMTFCAVIFTHIHLTAFFVTSLTPVSGAWSTGSRAGKLEITVWVPLSRHFHNNKGDMLNPDWLEMIMLK